MALYIRKRREEETAWERFLHYSGLVLGAIFGVINGVITGGALVATGAAAAVPVGFALAGLFGYMAGKSIWIAINHRFPNLGTVGKTLAFIASALVGAMFPAAFAAAVIFAPVTALVIGVAIVGALVTAAMNWRIFKNVMPDFMMKFFSKSRLQALLVDDDGEKVTLSTKKVILFGAMTVPILVYSALMSASVITGVKAFAAAFGIMGSAIPPVALALAVIAAICFTALAVKSIVSLLMQDDLIDSIVNPFKELWARSKGQAVATGIIAGLVFGLVAVGGTFAILFGGKSFVKEFAPKVVSKLMVVIPAIVAGVASFPYWVQNSVNITINFLSPAIDWALIKFEKLGNVFRRLFNKPEKKLYTKAPSEDSEYEMNQIEGGTHKTLMQKLGEAASDTLIVSNAVMNGTLSGGSGAVSIVGATGGTLASAGAGALFTKASKPTLQPRQVAHSDGGDSMDTIDSDGAERSLSPSPTPSDSSLE